MFSCTDSVVIILFTIALLHSSCSSDKDNSCATQHAKIKSRNGTYDIIWRSKSDFDYSVVLSEPPCLNEENNLAVRICSSGRWSTSPNSVCKSIEEYRLCPPNFVQEDKLCVYSTEPQPWRRSCPYIGASSFVKSNYNFAWLPIRRRIQYGPFEYVIPGEKYGSEFFDEEEFESDEDMLDADMDCAVSTTNGVELAPCDSYYPHICSYKYNQFLYRCPHSCVSGGLGSNYCFCKVHNNATYITKNQWCDALAVPRYSYERSILQKLVESDTCWIGDVQRNSSIKSFYFVNNLFLAIHKRGWSLHADGELNCAICKVPANTYPKAEMTLKFSGKSHKLYLSVYSPEGLLKTDEEESVYCFTDATGRLKTRIDTEEIWDSHFNSSSRRLKVYDVSVTGRGPGYYWCEAFQLPDATLIKSNKVIAYKEFKGHEYALRLRIHNFCRFAIIGCKNPTVAYISTISKSFFVDRFFSKFLKTVRLFHIYNINKQTETLDILLHLTAETKFPLISEYFALSRNIERLRSNHWNVIIPVFFRSSEVCLPESTTSGNLTLHWKMSAIGKVIIPQEVCVQENGAPVKRQCQGDFLYGSQWAGVEGNCSENVKISERTELLHSLVYSNLSTNLSKNISAITENSTDLTVLDLRYLAEALAKVPSLNQNNSEYSLDDVSQVIDNLMKTNTTTLKRSQLLLNTTDEILGAFESMLSYINISTELFLLKKSNLIIHISKPHINNISGIALYREQTKSFSDFRVKYLYANTSFNELLNEENLEAAVYVPDCLLDTISQNLSDEMKADIRIITTIFSRDNFFNSQVNKGNRVASRIVSVSIPGYGEFLQVPIPIIFKSQNNYTTQQECGFWKYGTNSETLSGYWSTLGGEYLGQLHNSSLETCSFSHLTNFALLVISESVSASDDAGVSYNLTVEGEHNDALVVISDIGCSLSVLGIFGIFVTSIVFKSWREKVGSRILIQLCITILLQIILLNVASMNTSSSDKLPQGSCTLVGIILHYVIISEFAWMLVAAILQFFRFVKVIGPMPNRIILKTMVIGWGLPLFPVLTVCAVSFDSYSAGIQGFCYPKGLSLYLGVLLPIAVIVAANLAVFITVIHNVFLLSTESQGNSQNIVKRQIYLAILLFFLLGLPWIFGLLGEIINHDSILSHILIYLFCLIATLQGFVLFLFYVVLDKSTRTLWYALFKKFVRNKPF